MSNAIIGLGYSGYILNVTFINLCNFELYWGFTKITLKTVVTLTISLIEGHLGIYESYTFLFDLFFCLI